MSPVLLAWDGVGFASGRPVRSTWEDMCHVIVCGESGSGKTWTVVFLVTQGVRASMKVALCDPHAGNRDSLYSRLAPLAPHFWRPAATNKAACLKLALQVRDELRRRIAEGERLLLEGKEWTLATHGDSPILWVQDEFNSLMRTHKSKLGDIVKEVSEEGRKFHVHMLASGQHWTVEAMGGSSELRDTIPSAIVHRCSRSMASMVLDAPQAQVQWAPKLADGQVYISIAGSDAIRGPYHVPPMTQQDVIDTSLSLTDDDPPMHVLPDSLALAPTQADHRRIVTPSVEKAIRAEAERAYRLFLDEGNSPGAAGLIIIGRPPSERGMAKNGAARVVEAIIRQRLRDLEAELAVARAEREQARATALSVIRPA